MLHSVFNRPRTTPDIPAVLGITGEIFEAIRAGDSDLAEHAMREHLQSMALDPIADRKG